MAFRIPALILLAASASSAVAQLTPDQQAEQAITAARKMYNDGNLPNAREQFKQVLAKFPNQQGTAARHGIALTYLNAPEPDYAAAIEPLTTAAGDGGYAEHGWVLYQLAAAQRAIGWQLAQKRDADPKQAQPKWEDALRRFGEAAGWFDGKKDRDLAFRCRCDAAEMKLRLNRAREVRQELEGLLDHADYRKTKYRNLGLYYHGLACFTEKEYALAGRSLNQIAPFDDPIIGMPARYLVGRVLHLNGDLIESSVHYNEILNTYEKQKNEAVELLKQPDRFRNNPEERRRLQALANGPPPDHVAGATFHTACLNYESGKFADALAKFKSFASDFPTSPMHADALLRVGFCQVQLKQFNDAITTLTPLIDKAPKLADQVQFWQAQAQLGLALATDPKAADRAAKFQSAIETYRKAVARAQQMAQQGDADARMRKGTYLVQLGDALQQTLNPKEAIKAYEVVWNEQLLPERRREEIVQRLARAYGDAGDHARSDQWCNEFKNRFPQSTLRPAVEFRIAENAYLRVKELLKNPDPNKGADLRLRYKEAATKFLSVVEQYPDFDRVSYARYAVGVCRSQMGDLEGAIVILEAIPDADRTGDIASASYLLADCLMRTAPAQAADEPSKRITREKLRTASQLLEQFVTAHAQSDDAPDAFLKLGLCLRRCGMLEADANERNQFLNKARECYEKLEREYSQSPEASHARLELAKVRALMGDRGGAMNDLRQFQNGERAQSPVAPLAFIHLATLLREENQPAEAVKVLDEARKKFEAALAQDKERADWAHLLKYHQGVALFESGQLPESRKLFDELVNAARGKPIGAEAALRSVQAGIAIGMKQIETGRQDRAKPNLKPNEIQKAEQTMQRGREEIYRACEQLHQRCTTFANALPNSEIRARMAYDSAWGHRSLMEHERNEARTHLYQQRLNQWQQEIAKPDETKSRVPPIPNPEIPIHELPIPRSEERTTSSYRRMIDEFPDLAITIDARFELAELQIERRKFDDAIELLKDAQDREPIDRAPSPDLLERIHLKLGGALSAKGDHRGAAKEFESVAANEPSPHRAQAIYRQGEALFALKDYDKAAERLAIFRDNPAFHQIPGISDRALLRLGQSLLETRNADASRQAFDTFISRFGNSPWLPDARYGLGTVLQAQSKWDEAVAQYQLVVQLTTAEVAARAQMQIGMCRMAQKRYADAAAALMLVPYSYDFPELGYAAVLEAAHAYEENTDPESALRVLETLLKSVPAGSEWEKSAKVIVERVKKRE